MASCSNIWPEEAICFSYYALYANRYQESGALGHRAFAAKFLEHQDRGCRGGRNSETPQQQGRAARTAKQYQADSDQTECGQNLGRGEHQTMRSDTANLGEGEFTDDPFDMDGGIAVCKIPRLRVLLAHLCQNGFELHVARTRTHCGDIVHEAISKYIEWDLYYYE